VDLLLDGRLIVKLDGRHHGEWEQVKKDQRRNNPSVVMGYAVLRYYYADVVHEPQKMVGEVLAVRGGRERTRVGVTAGRLLAAGGEEFRGLPGWPAFREPEVRRA
jgi:very-short-patch-repair endonuclease